MLQQRAIKMIEEEGRKLEELFSLAKQRGVMPLPP